MLPWPPWRRYAGNVSEHEVADPRIAWSWHISQANNCAASNEDEGRSAPPDGVPRAPLPRRPRPHGQPTSNSPSDSPQGLRRSESGPQVFRAPSDVRGRLANLRRGVSPTGTAQQRAIESATQALQRQAEPELFNEILASGAVAASVTAAATVAKAKIDATTQRRRDALDAETQRFKIESDERVAKFQATKEAQSARFRAQQPTD